MPKFKIPPMFKLRMLKWMVKPLPFVVVIPVEIFDAVIRKKD